MIRNFIKIARRNLQRNKAYASISVVGLALGISCGILIFTLINYHLSFDNFHNNSNRVYRFYTEWHDDGVGQSPGVPQPLGKAFRTESALGERTARTISFHNNLITITNGNQIKKFNEEDGVAFTEPGYFKILNFPLVKGNTKTALEHPNEAIITQKVAYKYFGSDSPIGKIIHLDNKVSFTVTGILKDFPANTDRKQQVYVSYGNMDEYTDKRRELNWGGVFSGCEVFTLLKPGVTVAYANNALKQMVKKHYTGRDLKIWQFKLQPLADIHFNPNLGGYADKKYLWALFFIGLFLIVTACVNFINLATAQALNRAKEIGIRKVLGSLPYQLFWQFIAETTIIALIATALAIVISVTALPAVNNLFQSQIQFNWTYLSLFILLITLAVIFLSGSYPGLVLARFQPILALKSKLSQKHIGGFSLRRILVVTQFSISQVLIIGTIIIVSQLHYSQTADLGFNKDNVVLLPVPQSDKVQLSTMRNRMYEVKGVEKVSYCFMPPASQSNNNTGVNYDNRAEDEHWSINSKTADENYISAFGITLIAGRNLLPADTTKEFLVNETFVKKLNLRPRDVLGKMLKVNGRYTKGTIVGVIKDFYNLSFHTEITPVCIMPDYKNYSTCAVRIGANNTKSALLALEKIWNNTYPKELYSYQFLNDSVAKFYDFDSILLKLIEAFAGIAILISCLGLYGLVSFMAVRKTKEIGVRKVLGAEITHVLWLFGKEFTLLLIIAFVIAAPLGWWAMTHYLQDFKYKISIGPGIFIASILSTFIIAAITVSYRSIMAALANPVKSLRSE
jgi:putative ABC transport system permease protein